MVLPWFGLKLLTNDNYPKTFNGRILFESSALNALIGFSDEQTFFEIFIDWSIMDQFIKETCSYLQMIKDDQLSKIMQ